MKNKSIVLFLIILVISLSGCSQQKSDKSIKLAFSKYDINENFLFNEEIEEYTNSYCEFYRNTIKLYNNEITDKFSMPLDSYTEYKLSFNIYDEMQNLINNMKDADGKKLATQMQINTASTNYLLTKLRINVQEESLKELYSDIVNNYEYIYNGK